MDQLIILAGGKGTRMNSDLPKVLTPVGGTPIIRRLLDAVRPVFDRPAIVVGYRAEEIEAVLGDRYAYVRQAEQLGTGHAVACAKERLAGEGYRNIVVVPGDHPFIGASTLERLLDTHGRSGARVTLATVSVPDFSGDFASFYNFGRIVRDQAGFVARIVEQKDASEEELSIREVNTGYYCFDATWLWENIDRLGDANAAHEYYLTDMVGLAHTQGMRVAAWTIENPYEGLGVNTPEQLAVAEAHC